jgi:hypothetical protein
LIAVHPNDTTRHDTQAYREVGIRAFVCPLVGDLPFDAAVAYGCGHGRSPYAGTDKHDPRKTDWIMAFMQNAVEVHTRTHAPPHTPHRTRLTAHARTRMSRSCIGRRRE